MTDAQKIVIRYLLVGYSLRQLRHGYRRWYVLYDSKINPVAKVKTNTVEKMGRYLNPGQKLWKIDRRGMMTLNLNTVRQLSGKTTIKKLYKQRAQLKAEGLTYKKPKKKITKKLTDEKANYLF